MTLSSRHRIRNSSPGGLRPSTLLLGHGGSHNTDFHTWMGKKHFCFFQTAETGNRTPNSGVKGSGANHYPRAPARLVQDCQRNIMFLPSILEHCYDVVSLARHLPSHASLDSDENEYLVGQRMQCVWKVNCAQMAAGLYAHSAVKMAHEWTGPVTTRGVKCQVGW